MHAYIVAIVATFILVVAWVVIEKTGEAYSRRHPECPARPDDCLLCIDAGRCLALAQKKADPPDRGTARE